MKKIFNKQAALRFLNSDYFFFGGLLCLILGYIIANMLAIIFIDKNSFLPLMEKTVIFPILFLTLFIFISYKKIYTLFKSLKGFSNLGYNSFNHITQFLLFIYLIPFILFIYETTGCLSRLFIIYIIIIWFLYLLYFIFFLILKIRNKNTTQTYRSSIFLFLFYIPWFVCIVFFAAYYQPYNHFYRNKHIIESILADLKNGKKQCTLGQISPEHTRFVSCEINEEHSRLALYSQEVIPCHKSTYLVYDSIPQKSLPIYHKKGNDFFQIDSHWSYICDE